MSQHVPIPSSSKSMSTPAGSKRRQPQLARPAKRHRAMLAYEAPNENGRTHAQQQGHKGIVDTLVHMFSRLVSFKSATDLEPATPAPGLLEEGRIRVPRQLVADNTIGDVTREPDEDLMPLSPPIRQDGQRSATLLGQAASGNRPPRRTPMYQDETVQRNKERKLARIEALRDLEASSSQMPSSNGYASSTSLSSLSYPASPNTSIHSPGLMPYPSQRSFNTSRMGFDTYQTLVDTLQFGDRSRIRSILPQTSRQKSQHGDVLAPRPPPQRRLSSGQDLERKLFIAQQSLKAPLPKTPKLPAYSKSRLKDGRLSEQIEDLTRRRRIWPNRMSEDNEKIVKATLRQAGVISTLPAAEVAQKDIVKLAPGEWLNDEVINFYGVMVNLRAATIKARRDKGTILPGDDEYLDIHVFSSFFFQKLINSGYAGVKKWSKKFDFFQKDIVIMPINLGNAHWVCAAINIRLKRFEYYDSMGKINHNILQKLRDYVEGEHLEKKKKPIDLSSWEDYSNPRTPQQSNGYDCGVFTSQFIECLSRRDGAFDFDQKNMPYLRQKMIHEIKLMELVPEQWFDPIKS